MKQSITAWKEILPPPTSKTQLNAIFLTFFWYSYSIKYKKPFIYFDCDVSTTVEKKCVDSPALAHLVVCYDLLLHSNTRKLQDLSIRSTLCMTPLNATINQVSWATFLPLFLDHHHHHLYFSGREEIYPLVPASISPFYWVFNSKLLASGFSNAGPHCAASRTL